MSLEEVILGKERSQEPPLDKKTKEFFHLGEGSAPRECRYSDPLEDWLPGNLRTPIIAVCHRNPFSTLLDIQEDT